MSYRYCETCYKLWDIKGGMPDYHWHVMSVGVPTTTTDAEVVSMGDLVTISFGG